MKPCESLLCLVKNIHMCVCVRAHGLFAWVCVGACVFLVHVCLCVFEGEQKEVMQCGRQSAKPWLPSYSTLFSVQFAICVSLYYWCFAATGGQDEHCRL